MNKLIGVIFVMICVFSVSPGNTAAIVSSENQTSVAECQNNERTVSACFWVKGFIYIGSGNPAVRIRGSNPRRVLGIKDDEEPILPENLSAVLTTANSVSGKFLFCPFSTRKKGHLQVGCVEQAEDLKNKN